MNDFQSRVNVLSVGVDLYSDYYFRQLHGVEQDLENIRNLFVGNSALALYDETRFIELYNPTSQNLRCAVNDFVISRSADGDILILYFSGHGVSIGRDDFGFCTTDTIIHPLTSVALPLSVVKFSELLSSLYVANVIPIFIIDACYSGIAGKALKIPSIEVISIMQHQLISTSASSYALFCSCADNQSTIDTPNGGIFSYYLHEIALRGLKHKNDNIVNLGLKDIYPILSEKIYSYSGGDIVPRLYLGETLPEFPICKNTKYHPIGYSLTNHLISVIEALWNNGTELSLTPKEIDNICGKGAYGNHSKLSLAPWQLVEDIPHSRKRKLTQRGKDFMIGKLKVPKTITQGETNMIWKPAENSVLVSYMDFKQEN
jgi:hypothetical protein